MPTGHALDLGCGEGGDALWLAERGWPVVAVDISDTALQRAAADARTSNVPTALTFSAMICRTPFRRGPSIWCPRNSCIPWSRWTGRDC